MDPGSPPRRPWEDMSDAQVQHQALAVAAEREAAITEALFRTRDALLASQQTTDESVKRLCA